MTLRYFQVLTCHPYVFFGKALQKTPIFKLGCLLYCFRLWTKICVLQIFYPNLLLLFCSLNNVFKRAIGFYFEVVPFIDISITDHAFSVVSKKSLPKPKFQRFFSYVFSQQFYSFKFCNQICDSQNGNFNHDQDYNNTLYCTLLQSLQRHYLICS